MGGTEKFFIEVQRCYERFDPETPPGLRPPAAVDVSNSDHAEEVARSGRFGPTVFRRYEQDAHAGTGDFARIDAGTSAARARRPVLRPASPLRGVVTLLGA
jgi:hypothetical protein